MSDITERARAAARRIMERFDSETVTLLRSPRDEYGQPTGEAETIGTARIWLTGLSEPSGRQLSRSGIRYDDEEAVWCALLGEDQPPAARHGDRVRRADGSLHRVRNIYADAARIRIFWQLEAEHVER